MRTLRLLPLLLLMILLGCKTWLGQHSQKRSAPTYSEFHQMEWQWENVGRVLILPALNESDYTRADEEVRAALGGELQKLGRFEVVQGPPDDRAMVSSQIHRTGRFDERIMIELGKAAGADVVLHVTITQYSPYPRPRLGLVIQAVSPRDAKVIASVDGLWDATDISVAERVRGYYRQRNHESAPFVRNHVIANDDSFAGELALESPALFQRFVCREVSLVLLDLPVPGVSARPKWSKRNKEPSSLHKKGPYKTSLTPAVLPTGLAPSAELGYKRSVADGNTEAGQKSELKK
mgnify:CR=1 FL=1